jgi:hypothetical protein
MQRRGKRASITIEKLLGKGVFCLVRPEAIKRGSRASREELRESLEMAVEND